MGFCIWVIVNGVKGGIEKWSTIMMPLIVVLLAVLAIRGITLPGGMKGISFLFNPRFEDLTASSIVLALGHSFFTVSLGMGTMMTYGSYLDKKQNLLNSALWVLFLDTAIAMLAGVAIFTTVFALGANPAEGPGLIFVVLPSVFPQLAAGTLWGTLFFALLFMAALTSAISILEVVTAYFIDQKGWSRKKATIQFGAVITIVGMFCSFSLGGGVNITEYLGISFFDAVDYLSSKYMLPLGGMFTAVFVLKRWGIPNFIEELTSGMEDSNLSSSLIRSLLTIAAGVVAFIIFNEIYSKIVGVALIG
jgi:NSS family neurotransmitter:Na+ symporter